MSGIDGIVNGIGSTLERVDAAKDLAERNPASPYYHYDRAEAFTGAAIRHAVDSFALGLPGATWNQRSAYRTKYDRTERRGAAVGDGMSVAASLYLARSWARHDYPTFAAKRPVTRLAARGMIGAVFAGAAATGTLKTYYHARDDGHAGALGATVGGVAALGYGWRRMRGHPIAAGGLVAATGALGYLMGRKIDTGPGTIGTPTDHGALVPAFTSTPAAPAAFLRGAWNHFADEGPHTPGASFGKKWESERTIHERYGDAELAGALAGDTAAVAFSGIAATTIAMRTLGYDPAPLLASRAGQVAASLAVPANAMNAIGDYVDYKDIIDEPLEDRVMAAANEAAKGQKVGRKLHERVLERLIDQSDRRAFRPMLWGGAAAMAGYTVYRGWSGGRGSRIAIPDKYESAALTAAGIGAGAVGLATRATAIRSIPLRPRIPIAIVASTVLVTAAQMMRGSLDQTALDAREAHRRWR